jgi:iron complex outermembrane receptor protein
MLFISNSTGWKSGVLADGKGWENLVVVPGFEGVEYQYRTALLEGQALANYETAWTTAVADENSALDYSRNLENIQDPEEVDAWELGMKSQFGAFTLNANIFYMDFTDMQVTSNVINPITRESTLTKTNAGSATSQGLEVEGTLLVGDAGTLSGSFAYLDAKYDEYVTADVEYAAAGQYWNPCIDAGCSALDFSGNKMPYAPELQLQLSYKHDIELGNGNTLVPRITLTYFDDMYLDAANRGDRPAGFNMNAQDPGDRDIDMQPAYAKIDLGITYKGDNDKWSVDVFANNVTDEEIRTSNETQIDGGFRHASTWEEGRALGMRLNYNF